MWLFLRLKACRGPMKAIAAVARTVLTAVSFMLSAGWITTTAAPTTSSGPSAPGWQARLARRLDELGFEVTLAERAAA
jgi:hypothetical protein